MRTSILLYDSLPECQLVGNSKFLLLFHIYFVIGWTSCRRSKFPSHWLSDGLSNENTHVRKSEVFDFSTLLSMYQQNMKVCTFRKSIPVDIKILNVGAIKWKAGPFQHIQIFRYLKRYLSPLLFWIQLFAPNGLYYKIAVTYVLTSHQGPLNN